MIVARVTYPVGDPGDPEGWHRHPPTGRRRETGRSAGSRMATYFRRLDMSLISRDLNGDGVQFVNAQLDAGGFLARAVLAVCGPVTRASAPLPESLDPRVFTSFEHGGVTSLDRTVDWLVPDILRSSHEEALVLLIEDSWFKPSDVLDPSKEPIFKLSEKNALVYALPKEQINADALKCVLSIIRSFCFTGFIIDGAASSTNRADGISASDLAKHTKSVFVSAFDGEGVIIGDWTPRTVT